MSSYVMSQAFIDLPSDSNLIMMLAYLGDCMPFSDALSGVHSETSPTGASKAGLQRPRSRYL